MLNPLMSIPYERRYESILTILGTDLIPNVKIGFLQLCLTCIGNKNTSWYIYLRELIGNLTFDNDLDVS